jgi:23S rRNA (cytosine1962-C5)-methyltransferase
MKVDSDLKPGDAVLVCDSKGKPLAQGHWCKEQGLCVRIFSFDPELKISEQFWWDRLLAIKGLRDLLNLPNVKTNGFRFIHGEGDGLSGLVVDIFGNQASIHNGNPGLSFLIPTLTKFLAEFYSINHVFLVDTYYSEGRWLTSPAPSDSIFLENGLSFLVDIEGGQKTGHFLDQQDNRLCLQKFAKGRDVLDAFCYSGGFSVYGMAGGARSVTSVDISEYALFLVKKNLEINKLEKGHEAVLADCFQFLRSAKPNSYDLIILDPPAFAKTNQAVLKASRGYKDINLLALNLVRPRGFIFTFSCSQHVDQDLFKKIIFAATKDSGRDVRILREVSQSMDHPVSVYCPQSNYLKGLLLYVE